MVDLLQRVHRDTGKTFLHVTHRIAEAEALGDCIVRLQGGGWRMRGKGKR